MKKRRSSRISAALAAGLLLLVFCALSAQTVVFAAESTGDGTYSVPVDLSGLAMGKDNFTGTATVEKQGDTYYFTFGFSEKIGYIRLSVDGADSDKEIGKTTEETDGWTYHTYTLSEANLKSSLRVAAYINAMKTEMSFSVALKWDARTKTSDDIRDLGERPAEFIPVIGTKAAASYSLRVGTVFPIPEAVATLGSEDCEVFAEMTLDGEAVEISNGKVTLDRTGTYQLVYRAVSSSYRTSLGNDTFAEYTVEVLVTTGENDTVKLDDYAHILPENTMVLAGKADESFSEYQKAASAMKRIADHFEVFSLELADENGDSVTPGGTIGLMFRADAYFDRTKVQVYYLDEAGGLTGLSAKGYGRYVTAETDQTGMFIVCVPGVAFEMPMWGYALIFGGIAVLLAAAVTATILLVKKQKQKQRENAA